MKNKKKVILSIAAAITVMIITLPFASADTISQIKKKTLILTNSSQIVEEEAEKEIIEEPAKPVYENIYIIGDSRSVGMRDTDEYNEKNHFYTAKVGEGYRYLTDNFESVLNKAGENDVIIINLGVNDLGNINKYIEYINNYADKTNLFVCTVGPVDEIKEKVHGYSVKNSEIESFNMNMMTKVNENVGIIEVYKELIKDGFDSRDGIHYTNDTYNNIIKLIDDEIYNK